MDRKPPFGGPQSYAAGASEAFRTVSLGTSVNMGKKNKGRGRSRFIADSSYSVEYGKEVANMQKD
jgi:hypothetical protein